MIPFNLGNVLDALGGPDQAPLAYRQAIARDPSFAKAWLNLAALHEGSGRVQEAIDAYGRALEARPDYPEALFNLASVLTRREKLRGAPNLGPLPFPQTTTPGRCRGASANVSVPDGDASFRWPPTIGARLGARLSGYPSHSSRMHRSARRSPESKSSARAAVEATR